MNNQSLTPNLVSKSYKKCYLYYFSIFFFSLTTNAMYKKVKHIFISFLHHLIFNSLLYVVKTGINLEFLQN